MYLEALKAFTDISINFICIYIKQSISIRIYGTRSWKFLSFNKFYEGRISYSNKTPDEELPPKKKKKKKKRKKGQEDGHCKQTSCSLTHDSSMPVPAFSNLAIETQPIIANSCGF